MGLSLLALHGWSKLAGFQKMAGGFPDPLKVGHRNSLLLSIIGEVVCPILVVLGLFTRLGALGAAINMGVAFFMIHKGTLKGAQSGELAFLFFCGFVVLLIAGAGRFALDAKQSGGSRPAKKPKPARD
jgi:putative oxidoreductase